MRVRTAVAMLSLIAGSMLAPHSASAACGFAGYPKVAKKMANENMTVDMVAYQKTDVYTVKLIAGPHQIFVESAADVDLIVCKKSGRTWSQVCTSTNPTLMPDACAAEGLEGWPGVGDIVNGPGTFQIHIFHCTHGDCLPADPGDPPNEAKPPVPYGLVVA